MLAKYAPGKFAPPPVRNASGDWETKIRGLDDSEKVAVTVLTKDAGVSVAEETD